MGHEKVQYSCKPRFKGIENFLRRVAFNLGNSPSQTEVKIISCIPIDVTDLQQKILCLEKELHAARKKNCANDKLANAVHCSSLLSAPNSSIQCPIKTTNDYQNVCKRYSDCCIEENESKVSCEYPYNLKQDKDKVEDRCPSTESVISKWDIHKRLENERVKNIFRKRKKKEDTQEESRGKTEMIYYTHTDTFNMDIFSRSYLTDIFRKHHDPKLVVNEFSDTSNCSQPMCRDDYCKDTPRDLDICSCCHGGFHNLDVYLNDLNIRYNPKSYNSKKKKVNMSKMVDLIPVKEELDKTKTAFRNKDIKCKRRNVYDPSPIKRVHTKQRNTNTKEFHEIYLPTTNKPKNKDKVNTQHKRKHNGIISPEEESRTCSIDCGDVYVKQKASPVTVHTQPNLHLVRIKNVANNKILKLTENVHSGKLKTTINGYTKTEVALNEIKKILQKVLAEVKKNALERAVVEEKIKRDAIIQKGASQNNLHQVKFPNYFPFGTSNCNNPYLVPYAGQIPVAQYCLPNVVFDSMRGPINPALPGTNNCPEKIQIQVEEKKVTTTSTNTDNPQDDTKIKQTEKLIQEIYKSVAISMDKPSKENSECDDSKSMFDGSLSFDKTIYDATENVSKVFKRDAQVEALLSTITSNTTGSNFVYTATSSRSGYPSKMLVHVPQNTVRKDKQMVHHYVKNNYITEESEFLDTMTSSESDDVDIKPKDVNIKDSKKNTLIMNMFRSMFKKKKREHTQHEEISSESDDYATVCSEKANNTRPILKRTGGINFVRPPAYSKQKKRTRYIDQKHRRQWNEDLIFHDNFTPKSIKTPQTGRGYTPNTAYYRDYETRAVLVDPKRNVPKIVAAKFSASKKISWLKKHRWLGISCGTRWKKFILDN